MFQNNNVSYQRYRTTTECHILSRWYQNKVFTEDIELQSSTYQDDIKTKLTKDIKPWLNVTFFLNDETKHFTQVIKPGLSATFYSENIKTKLVKDIELHPSVTFYPNDIKTMLAKDIKPPQSATFSSDNVKTKLFTKYFRTNRTKCHIL